MHPLYLYLAQHVRYKALVRLAKCHMALGDTTSALRALDQALAIDYSAAIVKEKATATTIQRVVESAREALASKDHRRAIYNIEQAVMLLTGSAATTSSSSTATPIPWSVLKAEALIGARRNNEANLMLNDVLSADANNSQAIYLRAEMVYRAGDLPKAVRFLAEALRTDPDLAPCRVLMKV